MLKRISPPRAWAALALALILCACGPVLGSRPTATYGFVRSPTPDLTQTTATPPATATPVPSDTPQPEPTATEPEAATTTPEPDTVAEPDFFVDEPVACEAAEDFVRCEDPVLGLSFEQPEAWGPISATLRESMAGTGRAYEYLYADLPIVNAGGRSADFTEGRGGMVTDFAGSGVMGFNDATPADWCAALTASLCEVVQPNVVLALRMPEALGLCDSPDFELQFRQRAYVWVLLPDNPSVNGFVFVAPFLSAEGDEHLLDLREELLGWDGTSHTTCTPDTQAEFDAEVAAYLADLENGEADADTLEMVAGLRHLAESIAPLT
jgi:hypothetical protein